MKCKPKLIIERLRDWSYGAFEDETSASCIAIGMTAEEAQANGERVLAERKRKNMTDLLKVILEYAFYFGTLYLFLVYDPLA